MKEQLYFKRTYLYKRGEFKAARLVQEEINNLIEEVFLKPINI